MYSTDYVGLKKELQALLAGERHWLANLANTAALLYEKLEDINWVGFYLLEDGELVLGPFQGKPACVRIALDRGVCGFTASRRTTTVVENVHEFPGHIACDPASCSEVVVPMIDENGELLGVLDVDSPSYNRFTNLDGLGLGEIVDILVSGSDWKR